METTDLHLPHEKTVHKCQTTEMEKLLKRFTWAGDIILKHSGKCVTKFPEKKFWPVRTVQRQPFGRRSSLYIIYSPSTPKCFCLTITCISGSLDQLQQRHCYPALAPWLQEDEEGMGWRVHSDLWDHKHCGSVPAVFPSARLFATGREGCWKAQIWLQTLIY